MFIQTIEHEPAECETLNLEPAFRHDKNKQEYVRIGVVDPKGISFQLVQFDENWTCKVLQAVLTDHEIDRVVEGLKQAQQRLRALNDY